MKNFGGGDGRKDGRTYGNSPVCPTGHWPFGAAAQKGNQPDKTQSQKIPKPRTYDFFPTARAAFIGNDNADGEDDDFQDDEPP